jgi:glycosyltransferase involved in cell wall biosynthesis
MRPLMTADQLLRTGGGWGSARAVERRAREVGADLIHTNTFTTPDGAVAARILGLPHVWHVRELVGDDQPFRFYGGRRGFGRIVPGSDFVVNSPATEAYFTRLVPAASVHVVPNGLQLDPLLDVGRRRGDQHASQPRLVVGMVASLTSTLKGHARFVEAAARCRDRADLEFRLYGADPSQGGGTSRARRYALDLHRQVDEAGLGDRFTFAGYCDDPVEIMRELDILVLPNEAESFGRVAVEAMAARACVVAADSDALRFVLDDGRAGVLVAPRDAGAIAAALTALADDPDRRAVLAEAGARWAKQAFSIERCSAAIVDLYREVLAAPAPAVAPFTAWANVIALRALALGPTPPASRAASV